jgi:hypothetical protein
LALRKWSLPRWPNASAVKIDKRGYLGVKAGKELASKLAIIDADLPMRFSDIGNFDEGGTYWRAFELSE